MFTLLSVEEHYLLMNSAVQMNHWFLYLQYIRLLQSW